MNKQLVKQAIIKTAYDFLSFAQFVLIGLSVILLVLVYLVILLKAPIVGIIIFLIAIFTLQVFKNMREME